MSVFALARRWAAQSLDLPTNAVTAPGLGLGALRRQRGITLVDLAERIGVSAATLSRFERGIAASRLLGRRVGGPDVAWDDRDVVLENGRLAKALGFSDSAALRTACLAAADDARA